MDLLFEVEAKGVSPAGPDRERRTIYIVDDSVGTVHDYTATAVAEFAQDQAQVDAVISSHLDKWQLDRLPAVDRAILRLATWELFNATGVDTVVIVDEAVQLAAGCRPTTRRRSSAESWRRSPSSLRRCAPPRQHSRRRPSRTEGVCARSPLVAV